MVYRVEDDIKMSVHKDGPEARTHFVASVNDLAMFLNKYSPEIINKVITKISEAIAAEFVLQYGPEIMARIDPQAIANMTIAAAGAKVNETLQKKFPDKVVEVVREGRDRNSNAVNAALLQAIVERMKDEVAD
jgi:adenosine/AMP kinase